MSKKTLSIQSGDVVEVYNDYGSSYALAYLEPDIKPNQTFMQFGHFNGVMGDLTTAWVDRNVVPYYKGTWADIRRIGTVDEFKASISFKTRRFQA
ncbi:molybdopterin dinucleotide binding domain-containing protein [Pseudomonas resinovorans]|uniref:molybdopterin dinucleotide binding domain-containing protein n=1 Tax=Metapseudomonas resinovorans TaxID=53412 RepID=UPI00237F9BBA|nr:molybdopterin dinucleotide binding domain-containing protein [Pseudomonas resinovorans]MDE3737901.1 molybdopterin dinucleotide binding domain-containing protein [Pseudomonas resinovorans]